MVTALAVTMVTALAVTMVTALVEGWMEERLEDWRGEAILSPLSFDHLWLVHLILWHSFYWPPMSGLRSQTGSLDYVVYQ